LGPDFVGKSCASVAGDAAFLASLSRSVHCVLGVPVDALSVSDALDSLTKASVTRSPFLMSTLNLNFIVQAALDPEFKESLLSSDLCTADGIGVIFVARLLGIKLGDRVAGSDLFEALKTFPRPDDALRIVFFGGQEGVADKAAALLNSEKKNLYCVKSIDPGFGSVEALSEDDVISSINSSEADMLIAALGAQKGQVWLLRNRHRLRIPIRTHLGAVLNFQAATIRRAPVIVQKMGLEWLWRIKEEPTLWRRYARDGLFLLGLIYTRIIPLVIYTKWLKSKSNSIRQLFSVRSVEDDECVMLVLSGTADCSGIPEMLSHLKTVALTGKKISIDLSGVSFMDSRFLGTLMVLRKYLKDNGGGLVLTRPSSRIRRLLTLSGAEFMIDNKSEPKS